MASAILYYRDETSTLSQYASPTALLSGKPVQCLEFDLPDNVLEAIVEEYENNIIDIPVPVEDGTRKINKQENGLLSRSITFNGLFKNRSPTVNADIQRLETLRNIKQIDTKHPFGRIGFYSPNAERFSIDPNATNISKATYGYTIKRTRIGYIGRRPKRYDFSVTLTFGGVSTIL